MSTAPRKIGILLLAVCLSFTRSMLPCIWRHPRWQRGGLSYFQGTRALTRFSLPRRNRVTCIRRDRHPQVFQTPDTRSIPSFSSRTRSDHPVVKQEYPVIVGAPSFYDFSETRPLLLAVPGLLGLLSDLSSGPPTGARVIGIRRGPPSFLNA